MQNRRNFLTQTALAGTALAIGLPAFARESFSIDLTANSLAAGTHLTPILAVDDALRLSLLDRSLNADVKAAMIANQAFYESSGALAHSQSEVLSLLGMIRDNWDSRDKLPVTRHEYNGDMLESKLAFVTGWLAHQAVQQKIYGDHAITTVDERAIYHDATLCRAIYKSEPMMAKATKPSVEELAELLQLMYLRTYIRMHTIDPDFDDVENWIVRYVKWSEDTKALTYDYAKAYLEPDAEKVKKYVKESNFYNPSDPIITLARDLHQGITDSPVQLNDAITASAKQSQFAQALGAACDRIAVVGTFMDGGMDQATLKNKLAKA